jgi:hypothetical protein
VDHQTAPEPASGGDNLSLGAPEGPLLSLEERLHRLEEAVASLQDTQAVEARILERLSGRLPKTTSVPAPDGAFSAGSPPPSPNYVEPSPVRPEPGPRSWLLFDFLAETRTMIRMFVDIRYHVAWTTRVLALFLIPLILTSHLWNPLAYIPLVGLILDKVVDFVLIFLLYRALSREARRYRETKLEQRYSSL